MPNMKDVENKPSKVRLLLIGDSGSHKTFFAGTCPKPYIFDFDGNLAVLRGRDVEYDTFREAPKSGSYVNPDEGMYAYGTAWPRVIDKVNDLGEWIDAGDFPFETLVFDSLTMMGEIALNHVMRNISPKDTPLAIVDPGSWGQQQRLLQTVFEQVTAPAWKVNIVVTAHIQRNENKVTGDIEFLPLVTGKLAGKIGIPFNEVWYTEADGYGEDREFRLITESDGMRKQAKTTHGIPDGTDPHWDNVKEYFGYKE